VSISTSVVSLGEALDLIQRVIKAAEAARVPVAVAVTDGAGQLVASARMDGVSSINLQAAQRKAFTSATFGAPTGNLAQMVSGDAMMNAALSGDSQMLLLAGGFPLMENGQKIGAVGVAGGHYSQDEAIAKATLTDQQ
jgi:glc operon protein GlcG